MRIEHKKLVGAILILLASYLTFVFCLWEFNPANWSESERVFCALLGVPAAAMFALVVNVGGIA